MSRGGGRWSRRLRLHTSAELRAGSSALKQQCPFDGNQIVAAGHSSSRRKYRRSSIRENRRTTSGESLPTLLSELRETPYTLTGFGWPPPEARQGVGWRTGRDSNPRWLLHHARFPSVCLKPLGHLSLSAVGRPYSAVDSSGNGIFPAAPAWLVCRPRIWGFCVLFRALGWLLLAMAIAVAVQDALAWWTKGSFHLLGLGELWSRLDIRSLSERRARCSVTCRRRCGTRSSGRS